MVVQNIKSIKFLSLSLLRINIIFYFIFIFSPSSLSSSGLACSGEAFTLAQLSSSLLSPFISSPRCPRSGAFALSHSRYIFYELQIWILQTLSLSTKSQILSFIYKRNHRQLGEVIKLDNLLIASIKCERGDLLASSLPLRLNERHKNEVIFQ